ncbi:MAG: glutamate 5-kinase [Catenisphaera adipataccumulans]|jgi:glutamate 5-kinase|uniref:glutamate 5-kinase n=1 Tax=Catenisphaera adipataccumulans TaxID=700500 RepID=UPI003D8AD8E4
MRDFSNTKRMIIKFGSSSLCDDHDRIDPERILNFIRQIAMLHRRGIQVTVVSSGAINAGVQELKLRRRPNKLSQKQALAAIGQASLMKTYENLFRLFHLQCAQILLNHDDFDDRKRLLNLYNALQAMFDYNVIPIINENDTLAVDEIKVGDNDTLASLMVPVVNADLVILVSDVDGLYNQNPHENPNAKLIHDIDEITPAVAAMAGDTDTNVGTGGMVTKLRAAKICNEFGCDMAIINADAENGFLDLMDGKPIGTFFNGKSGRTLSARQHWILYRSRPRGRIVIDDGCAKAIRRHKSLLPSGVVSVEGYFSMSAVVDVIDIQDRLIARGIVNYNSEEINKIKGLKTNEIESVLHYKDYDEVIHANNMVLKKEMQG